MKVNFCVPFKDFNGKPIEGAPQIAEQLRVVCYGASQLKGQPLDDKAKYQYYLLCRKLASCGEVELSAEECVMIKQIAAEAFGAGGYGQIVDIVEQK